MVTKTTSQVTIYKQQLPTTTTDVDNILFHSRRVQIVEIYNFIHFTVYYSIQQFYYTGSTIQTMLTVILQILFYLFTARRAPEGATRQLLDVTFLILFIVDSIGVNRRY